jgi:hypothetical protein
MIAKLVDVLQALRGSLVAGLGKVLEQLDDLVQLGRDACRIYAIHEASHDQREARGEGMFEVEKSKGGCSSLARRAHGQVKNNGPISFCLRSAWRMRMLLVADSRHVQQRRSMTGVAVGSDDDDCFEDAVTLALTRSSKMGRMQRMMA